MNKLPTYDDVISAAKQIEGHAHHTPVFTSSTIDRETGSQFFSSVRIFSASVHSSFEVRSTLCHGLRMSKRRGVCWLFRPAIMPRR